MPYIGRGPAKSGAFRILDDFSASFDGSETTFALTVGSTALTVGLPETLIIAVDGVIQEPGTGYTISGSNIVFGSAPQDSATFWGVELGDVGGLADRATTQAANDNTTKVATTAYVQTELGDYAPLAAPTFTGNAAAVTQAATDDSTRIATTAHVKDVKIDDLTAGDDNTDLDSSTSRHGLLLKLGGGTTNFLRADGTWNAPAGGASITGSPANTNIATFTNSSTITGGTLNSNGSLTWGGTDLTLNVTSSASAHFRIESAGSTATNTLELRNNHASAAGASNIIFRKGTSGTNSWYVGMAGNGSSAPYWRIYNENQNWHAFYNKIGEQKVGIGTTSPAKALHVLGDGFQFENTAGAANETTASFLVATDGYSDEFGSIRFEDNRGTQAQPSFIFAAADGSGGTACFLIKTGTTSTRFQLNQNGDITGTHGNYHTSSDLRAKENIVNSTVGLDAVMQMRPVKFNFIADRGVGTNTRVGFIAQEVEALIPEAVFTADTPNDPIPNIKSIEDPQLIPVLVKAIQELKAEIDALKA